MAYIDPYSTDSPHDGPGSETAARRFREQNQLDFELDFFGRLLDRDPLYVDALRVHAGNLAARGHYHRALQFDRRLVRLQPDRPIPWYNLSCSFALLGMLEPAFEALERSVELGYRHVRWLCRDPDLKPLRQDPRFARLLRRVIMGAR